MKRMHYRNIEGIPIHSTTQIEKEKLNQQIQQISDNRARILQDPSQKDKVSLIN